MQSATSMQRYFSPFQIFKYTVYILLSANLFVFFGEEYEALGFMFKEGVTLSNFIEAFPATIDTAAWLGLLLMFELETYSIPDHAYTKTMSRTIHALRVLCIALVVYASYGYIEQYAGLQGLALLTPELPYYVSNDMCSYVGGAFMDSLDSFEAITAENCAGLVMGSELFALNDGTYTDSVALAEAQWLATIDVANALAWIVVVLVIEAQVRLQVKHQLSTKLFFITRILNFSLYVILFSAAVFWWIDGEFVDFWDAALWLIAFFFIESNISEWREEEEEQQEAELAEPTLA